MGASQQALLGEASSFGTKYTTTLTIGSCFDGVFTEEGYAIAADSGCGAFGSLASTTFFNGITTRSIIHDQGTSIFSITMTGDQRGKLKKVVTSSLSTTAIPNGSYDGTRTTFDLSGQGAVNFTGPPETIEFWG